MCRVLALCGRSPQTACSWVRMELLTVTQKEHSQPTCCPLVIRKVILHSDQKPNIIDVKNKASTHIPIEIVYEASPVGDTPTEASSEPPKQSKHRFVQSRTSQSDRSLRRWALTKTTQHNATQHNASSVMKWLVRLAGWTLTAFHVRGDGMTARQRIRAKSFKQQLAAFGAQILFKPQKTSGQQLAVK